MKISFIYRKYIDFTVETEKVQNCLIFFGRNQIAVLSNFSRFIEFSANFFQRTEKFGKNLAKNGNFYLVFYFRAFVFLLHLLSIFVVASEHSSGP